MIDVDSAGCRSTPFTPTTGSQNNGQVRIKQKQQPEVAVTSAPALRQQFSVNGKVLEQVEVFKYLGRLLAQEDDDIQATHAQLRKARAAWAWVGQVLRNKKVSPHVTATFYNAVV
jgi:hypothetical protein